MKSPKNQKSRASGVSLTLFDGEGRARKIGRSADRVLCLFPMEPAIYARHGIDARFVGHPLADEMPLEPDVIGARRTLGLDSSRPVLALLPGSRVGEIERLGPAFLAAAARTLAQVPLAGGMPREIVEGAKYADWAPGGRDLALVRRDGAGDVLEFPVGTRIAGDGVVGFGFPRVSPRGDAVAAFVLEAPESLVGTVAIFGRDGRTLAVTPVSYFNVFGLAWRGDEVWFTAAGERPLFRNALHAMDAAGNPREPLRSMPDGVHPGDHRQQHLRRADVAGRLLAPDVLFPRA